MSGKIERFRVMSVPGRDGSDKAAWFVVDIHAAPDDPGRSVPCDNRPHAVKVRNNLERCSGVRYWRNMLRLHGTEAAGRLEVFPAGGDPGDAPVGVVEKVEGGWAAFGVGGRPVHLRVQHYDTMDQALMALVCQRLIHSGSLERKGGR